MTGAPIEGSADMHKAADTVKISFESTLKHERTYPRSKKKDVRFKLRVRVNFYFLERGKLELTRN